MYSNCCTDSYSSNTGVFNLILIKWDTLGVTKYYCFKTYLFVKSDTNFSWFLYHIYVCSLLIINDNYIFLSLCFGDILDKGN